MGIFATLTIVFAAATALEYQQVASLNSQIPAESTTASCTATGGIGCPHFFNDTYTVSVNYVGPWGLTYQGYFGDSQASGQLVESGSFYGNSSANETVVVAGTSSVGTLLCAVAQKLDGSNSTLLLTIRGSSANQTYVAYGSTKVCVAHVIA